LHVVDHCRAIEQILAEGEAGQTYNVGSGDELDIEGIADAVLDAYGLDTSFKAYVADRPGHDRRYLLDSRKIHESLGWQPEVEFRKGLRDTLEWYRSNEAWWRPLLQEPGVDEEHWRE
jgi:dTDP-glucose 4,6-dehydratase